MPIAHARVVLITRLSTFSIDSIHAVVALWRDLLRARHHDALAASHVHWRSPTPKTHRLSVL
jgi:hypothetical protein